MEYSGTNVVEFRDQSMQHNSYIASNAEVFTASGGIYISVHDSLEVEAAQQETAPLLLTVIDGECRVVRTEAPPGAREPSPNLKKMAGRSA